MLNDVLSSTLSYKTFKSFTEKSLISVMRIKFLYLKLYQEVRRHYVQNISPELWLSVQYFLVFNKIRFCLSQFHTEHIDQRGTLRTFFVESIYKMQMLGGNGGKITLVVESLAELCESSLIRIKLDSLSKIIQFCSFCQHIGKYEERETH